MKRFSEEHEWISVSGDVGTVGISDYAQSQLGDIVYVEVPEAGKKLTKGGEAAVGESVKAASDVYSPQCTTRRPLSTQASLGHHFAPQGHRSEPLKHRSAMLRRC